MLKGTTRDFNPTGSRFHLFPPEGGPAIGVQCADLKALYFVRSFEGDPKRTKPRGFVEAPPASAQGRKIAVRFQDGELLCGYSMGYSPGRAGFFLFPADVNGNNLRVFVMTEAAAEIQTGPEAEALAKQLLGGSGTVS